MVILRIVKRVSILFIIITITSLTHAIFAYTEEKLNIKVFINNSLDGDEKTLYLYFKDCERTYIPSTLDECYSKLDDILSDIEKAKLKSISQDKLFKYHFTLGLWIRNHWIYPEDSNIKKILLDKGITHPDYMSGEIIYGYYNYLNNGLNDSKKENTTSLYLIIPLIISVFVIAFLALVFKFKRKFQNHQNQNDLNTHKHNSGSKRS